MAGEVIVRLDPSLPTVYATYREGVRYWLPAGDTLETVDPAHWGQYDFPLAETQAGSGVYVGDCSRFVDGCSGVVEVFEQAGASPDPDDAMLAAGEKGFSAAERNGIADAVLTRDVASVEAAAGEHSLCYLVLAAGESNTVDNPGYLTVYRTDGLTEFVRKTIASSPSANPITGIS